MSASNPPPPSNDEPLKSEIYRTAKRQSARQYIVEIYSWFILGLVLNTKVIVILFSTLFGREKFIAGELLIFLADNSTQIILGCGCAVFPLFFRQIFGELPLAALRERVAQARSPSITLGGPESVSVSVSSPSAPAAITKALEAQSAVDNVRRLDPRELLAFYADQTSQVTRQIYSRAGVYLMVGVIIAFSGLAFFYIRSRDLVPEKDYIGRALAMAPGFGVLFFIEFVAFFFLRQYRLAMEEFRYFDAVRRRREENLVILKMFAESSTVVSTNEVLAAMSIYSTAGTLSKDQTTEMLESRKLQKDEIAIFDNLLEVVSALRGSKSAKS